jgi:transposase-like protein
LRFVSKLSAEQWAEARRLRADGASIAAVARRFGLTPAAMGNRARKEGWSSPATAADRRAQARRPSSATAEIRAELARRLFSVIAVQIRMKELYMHKQLEAYEKGDAGIDPPATAKDQQADFAALIESIKQVTEIDSEPPATGDGRRPAANPELTALSSGIDPDALAAASEKDAFRRDIAERLGKLFPKA